MNHYMQQYALISMEYGTLWLSDMVLSSGITVMSPTIVCAAKHRKFWVIWEVQTINLPQEIFELEEQYSCERQDRTVTYLYVWRHFCESIPQRAFDFAKEEEGNQGKSLVR